MDNTDQLRRQFIEVGVTHKINAELTCKVTGDELRTYFAFIYLFVHLSIYFKHRPQA